MLRDRVLRASLVGVAKKQTQTEKSEPEEAESSQNESITSDEK
jgi:hypothetical protein